MTSDRYAVEPTPGRLAPGMFLVRDTETGMIARKAAARENGSQRHAYFHSEEEAEFFAAKCNRRDARLKRLAERRERQNEARATARKSQTAGRGDDTARRPPVAAGPSASPPSADGPAAPKRRRTSCR